MFEKIKEEIAVVFERDPAARSTWEVVTCYPGFHALLAQVFDADLPAADRWLKTEGRALYAPFG